MVDDRVPSSREPGVRYVFRPWRRCPRTGEKLWAKNFGLKAWRIPVSDGDERGGDPSY
jgi:hypothetical protein